MDHFGKFSRRTQPLSQIGKYSICGICYNIVFSHRYIKKEERCQLCSIRASEDDIIGVLQVASKSPGLTHLFKKILYDYL